MKVVCEKEGEQLIEEIFEMLSVSTVTTYFFEFRVGV